MTYEEIKNRVTDVCGIEVGLNFTKKTNKREYLYPRMIVAYHLRMQGWFYNDIAYMLNRDQTTVVYYIKKYNDEYRHNYDFRNLADKILKE